MKLVAAVVAATLGLGAGCKTTSSNDLPTSGISAEIRVSATSASESSVRVQMSPGDSFDPVDVVELGGGDALYADDGGLREKLFANTFDYQADFGAGGAETQFRVSFDRARADYVDAPDSVGTLPAPFQLGPGSIADMPRSQPSMITWSPSGTADRMTLEVQGSCVEDFSVTIDGDPGSYPLNLDGETYPSSCTVTMKLHRSRAGVVDPNLSPGSSFVLEQVRTAAFHSSP
jgi:hypothetical protein